jgi:invasion protein IalB
MKIFWILLMCAAVVAARSAGAHTQERFVTGTILTPSGVVIDDGVDPQIGASDAIINEDASKTAIVEWRYVDVTGVQSKQAQLKTARL